MNKSISFDRAASIYDSTRDLPEPIAMQGIQAILDAAGSEARILDVGTGTGRISVPLLKHGADLFGCDLSPKMMALLQQKFPAARLARADASLLPFPSNHFDALTTCHVMHLVGPWREALREYRRVLKPGGVYINARTEDDGAESVGERVREFWQSRVVAAGADPKRPGIQDEKELHAELLKMGAEVRINEIVRFSRPYSVQETVERIANRTDSHTWEIPEDIFSACLRELRNWAAREFGDLNKAYEERSLFVLDLVHFKKQDN